MDYNVKNDTNGIDDAIQEFFYLESLYEKNMPEERCGLVYHYTSIHGFQSILFGQDKVKIWASRYDCMNDTSEGKIVNDIYKVVCYEMLKDGDINKEQYDLIIDLEQNDSCLVTYKLDESDQNLKCIELSCDRYLCCFSNDPDSLAMWNYYTKDDKYEGYNIGLDYDSVIADLNKLSNYGIRKEFYPVIYDEDKQKELVRNYINKIIKHYYPGKIYDMQMNISEQLFDWSLIFKSRYFKHEDEVRLIIYVPKKHPNDVQCREYFSIKHRFNNGLVIPYIELDLNKSCVINVNISPIKYSRAEKDNQINISKELLENNDYNVSVKCSKVPIRY